jgi:2-amino-4-hydroxy-6-hydroxymethyldihydropteridine diphosphokinase
MVDNVFLLLGSNQGDAGQNIASARERIEQHSGKIIRMSPLYQTKPWGFDSQDLFINQALQLQTSVPAEKLLEELLSVEKSMGRVRMMRGYESRIIDIDILFYNSLVMKTDSLVIPHPRLHLRNFVLYPLCDIAPGFMHPILKKTMAQLKDHSPDDSFVVAIP